MLNELQRFALRDIEIVSFSDGFVRIDIDDVAEAEFFFGAYLAVLRGQSAGEAAGIWLAGGADILEVGFNLLVPFGRRIPARH